MRKFLPEIKKLLLLLLGNALYSTAVACFLLPAGLITGGATGIAIFVHHYTGLSVSAFVTIFNVAMFLLGAVALGRRFAATTLVSTFVYPLFLQCAEGIVARTGAPTQDPMLCTVFAGLLIGAGIALVLQQGASTGGMDIPPLMLQKYAGVPVSVSLYAFDVVILLLQMTFSNAEQVLYGILLVCAYTLVLERLLVLGKSQVQVKIVSTAYREINQAILQRLDRGTTLFEIEGGYTRREMYAILTVVSPRELFKVTTLAREIDPDAFIIIGQVREVRGRGFTLGKKYE